MTMVARLGLSHHGPGGTEVSILAHPGLFPPLRGTEVPGRGSGKVRRHFPLEAPSPARFPSPSELRPQFPVWGHLFPLGSFTSGLQSTPGLPIITRGPSGPPSASPAWPENRP